MKFKIDNGKSVKDLDLERILLISPYALRDELKKIVDEEDFEFLVTDKEPETSKLREVAVKMMYSITSELEDRIWYTNYRLIRIFPIKAYNPTSNPFKFKEVGATLVITSVAKGYGVVDIGEEGNYLFAKDPLLIDIYKLPQTINV